MTTRHGITTRQPAIALLNANNNTGLFGRMFSLPALSATDAALLALANAMKSPANDPDSKIPAGFTYLGQFVDHDITFDQTPLSEQVQDPTAVENFRTPALDLDSLYANGPGGSPHLYERDRTKGVGAKLLIGTAAKSPKLVGGSGEEIPAQPNHDLFRNPLTGIAFLGDPRNDENLLVAQLHVAMMNFHNRVVDNLAAEGVPDGQLFERARELVIWHYQWVVLHDFLERITGEVGITERITKEKRQFYRFKKRPYMPIEFSAAAFRFGHSMVREAYSHNLVFRPGGPANGTLQLLFQFTAKSGNIMGAIPGGNPVLPSNWVIDWRRFFDFATPATTPNFALNFAHQIDPFVTPTLHTLPGEAGPSAVLPFRNLKRGVMMRLPSGQRIAREMNLPVLTAAELSTGPDGAVAIQHGFEKETPLWYYLLKEAQVKGGGQHLGPVGATIVAEVLIGIAQGSAVSYFNAPTKFAPTLGATPGVFTMVDLLNFANVVNPLGD